MKLKLKSNGKITSVSEDINCLKSQPIVLFLDVLMFLYLFFYGNEREETKAIEPAAFTYLVESSLISEHR